VRGKADAELTPEQLKRRNINRRAYQRRKAERAAAKAAPAAAAKTKPAKPAKPGLHPNAVPMDEAGRLAMDRAQSLDETRAEKLRLEIDVMKGRLCPVDDIKATAHRKTALLKASIDAAPARYKSLRPDASPEDLAALRKLLAEMARDYAGK